MRTVLLAIIVPLVTAAAWADGPSRDLTELSIEELMDIEITVTSAAKKPQKLTEAPAAISVITGDQIRRAGVTTIPEALRLVPGMHVARVDANKWAISSRGFDGRISNKLLVLLDGRHVYTPLFTGVFWEVQDTVLDDIDRIEIIRGPGGTLWGANAVNGVINVVTKNAKDTQSGLVRLGAGTEERAFGAVRYGGTLGPDAYYRVYAKYLDRDGFVDETGADTDDSWQMRLTGFRIDWDLTPDDSLTIEGDYYDADGRQTVIEPVFTPPFGLPVSDEIDMTGGDLSARWQRHLGEDSDLALQAYHHQGDRDEAIASGDTAITEVEFQHRFPAGERHDLLWGLGVRITSDQVHSGAVLSVEPAKATDTVYHAFIQDEIAITPEQLSLTVGSKFEHNDYTGFEYQPSVRLTWVPTAKQTVWAAVSRAVRTPSRTERRLHFTMPGTADGIFSVWMPSPDYDSETLLAYELGYRVQPSERLALDATAFYNRYDNLQTSLPGMPTLDPSPLPHTVLPLHFGNDSHGTAYGFELAADFKASERWRLYAGYSLLKMEIDPDDDALPGVQMTYTEGKSPEQMAILRSSWALPGNVDFDITLRYVDALPAIDVESYTELDARAAWRPTPELELFVVGQSLLDAEHAEFRPAMIQTLPTQVERSVYVGMTWHF
jgi:iron complex outermembrane receptor protein